LVPKRSADDGSQRRHRAENSHRTASKFGGRHQRDTDHHANECRAISDEPKHPRAKSHAVGWRLAEQHQSHGHAQQATGERALFSYALGQHAGWNTHYHRHQAVEPGEQPNFGITQAEVFLDGGQQWGETQARHLNRHHGDYDGGESAHPIGGSGGHRLYATPALSCMVAATIRLPENIREGFS
jgi:hypothetical protein